MNLKRLLIVLVVSLISVTSFCAVVNLSEGRAILVDGKPFFPICVWQQPDYLFDYHKYLGINSILCPPAGEDKLEYLKACLNKGLYVFTAYRDEFKNHPAVLGWIVINRYNPELVKKKCEELKNIDPNHLVYVHLSIDEILNFKPEEKEKYETIFEKADVAGCHVYPMGMNLPGKLDMVGDVVDFMNKYSKGKMAPLIDLECAKLEKGKRIGTPPTPAQVRCEIWEAIVHGAKAICYFTISFEPFVWSQIPARNEMVLKYNNDLIQRLKEVILLGKEDVKVEKEVEEGLNISTMVKRDDKDIYIFAVNTANQEGRVKFKIDKQYVVKEIKNYEEKRELNIKDNIFEEEFAPYEVKIYLAKLK